MSVWHVEHFSTAFEETKPSGLVIASDEFDFAVEPMFDAIIFQVGDKLIVKDPRSPKHREAPSEDHNLAREALRLHHAVTHRKSEGVPLAVEPAALCVADVVGRESTELWSRGKEGEAFLHDAFAEKGVPVHENDTVVNVVFDMHQLVEHVSHSLAFATFLTDEVNLDFSGAGMFGQSFPENLIFFVTTSINDQVKDGGDRFHLIEDAMKHSFGHFGNLPVCGDYEEAAFGKLAFLRLVVCFKSKLGINKVFEDVGPNDVGHEPEVAPKPDDPDCSKRLQGDIELLPRESDD